MIRPTLLRSAVPPEQAGLGADPSGRPSRVSGRVEGGGQQPGLAASAAPGPFKALGAGLGTAAVLGLLAAWACLALVDAAQPAEGATWPLALALGTALAVLAVAALVSAWVSALVSARFDARTAAANPASTDVHADTHARAGAPALARLLPSLADAVFRNAAAALIVSDRQGVVRALNPAAERLLGCGAAQLVGQATLASLHDRDDLPLLAVVLREQLAAARAARPLAPALRNPGGERTWHYRRCDGARVPVSVATSVLPDEQGQVAGFLCVASDITERLHKAERLSHQAHHDALTGLANRHRLLQHLSAAITRASSSARPLAVVFIDLDGFKPINDTHGHAVGDAVLCEVAARLRRQVHEPDLVARLGGDEFVLVLGALAHASAAAAVAEQLTPLLTRPMVLAGRRVQVGASIGVALHPEGGSDPQALLRTADARMYQVKRARRLAAGPVNACAVAPA